MPANRPITLRDLLTLRLGIGAVMAHQGRRPIQGAMEEAGLAPAVRLALAPAGGLSTPNKTGWRVG